MDRITRIVKMNKVNKYKDPIGLDNNLGPIKTKYKYNTKNEIVI